MALPSSGNQITLNQVNVELGDTGTDVIGLNDADVRSLFGVSSGEIEMADGYGKSNISPWYGVRGIFAGGYFINGNNTDVIEYITISSTGNTTDFGNIEGAARAKGACSNSTRMVIGGSNTAFHSGGMDYITTASTGNTTDFGDMSGDSYNPGACGNDTRGLWSCIGIWPATNVIEYITTASVGNTTDFGDMTMARSGNCASNSTSRAVFSGGSASNTLRNIIDYVTIASTGNASDFGDMTLTRSQVHACESPTRVCFLGGFKSSGGWGVVDNIDYITTASTGNATDFGDLNAPGGQGASCSNGTRGVMKLSRTTNFAYTDAISYITIASTGNGTDFGNSLEATDNVAGSSGTA